MSGETILRLLPLDLAAPGATGAAAGLVNGLGGTVADLPRVFAGYAAERLGRKQPPVLAGCGLSALGRCLFPPATGPSAPPP
ncbi:MAG TPA: hypothetical protein DCM14_07130 [Clostridiales bacterium UBA8153]|nr:hypothetical protein [Clostridiales bacterium UBA8153]